MPEGLEIAAIAQSVLGKMWGTPVRITDAHVLKDGLRAHTLRCWLEPRGGQSRSVIVKHLKQPVAEGFTEWASLRYLTDIGCARELAPRFYGGNLEPALYVMEDWGDVPTLEDVLNGNDRAAATAALNSLAVQSARLQVATLQGESTYTHLRAGLPLAGRVGRQREVARWRTGVQKLHAWFTALSVAPSVAFDSALEDIARHYLDPGPLLAFTHGDPAPSNAVVAGGESRLLDFEYGGFRHALYDITAWEVLCPLPYDVLAPMRQAFYDHLTPTCPALQAKEQFTEAWALMCSYRALALLSWISPEVLTADAPRTPNWTTRQAVRVTASRLAALTQHVRRLRPVHEVAAALAGRMQTWWPEVTEDALPAWPALR